MGDKVEFLAPAKINLRLEIWGKREDGYHEIRSLICPIGIYDTISLTQIKEKGIFLGCEDKDLPPKEDNLCFQAARCLWEEAKISRGIKIKLSKRIPVAAGLGGGSSDAAATLKGINKLFSLRYSLEKLKSLGARVGSDVPFFFIEGPAWATGRGENLLPLRLSPQFWVLLVNPGVKISTAWAYSLITPPFPNDSTFEFSDEINLLQFGKEILFNDFERVIEPWFPVIGKIKKTLQSLGAWGTLMSGSGPTVFGIFFAENEAKKAKKELTENYREENWRIFLAPALLPLPEKGKSGI